MWSILAVLLGIGGVLAALALGELEELPLFSSPRSTTLALACGALLGGAALLTVLGLTTWHWAVPAMAIPVVVGVIRFVARNLPDSETTGKARDELLRRHGPRGL